MRTRMWDKTVRREAGARPAAGAMRRAAAFCLCAAAPWLPACGTKDVERDGAPRGPRDARREV